MREKTCACLKHTKNLLTTNILKTYYLISLFYTSSKPNHAVVISSSLEFQSDKITISKLLSLKRVI